MNFKSAVFLFFVLISFLPVNASLRLLYPVDALFERNDSIESTSFAVQPGETFLLRVSRQGKFSRFISIEVKEAFLPENWQQSFLLQDKSMDLRITVPPTEREGLKNLVLVLSDGKTSEEFFFRVFVKKNLLTVVLKEPVISGETTKPVFFKAVVSNQSIASHEIVFDSDLPLDWFSPLKVEVSAKQSKEVLLKVVPGIVGKKSFSFVVKSVLNNQELRVLNAVLLVQPSLQGKLFAPFQGVPFFEPGLFPVFAFNALLSLLQTI